MARRRAWSTGCYRVLTILSHAKITNDTIHPRLQRDSILNDSPSEAASQLASKQTFKRDEHVLWYMISKLIEVSGPHMDTLSVWCRLSIMEPDISTYRLARCPVRRQISVHPAYGGWLAIVTSNGEQQCMRHKRHLVRLKTQSNIEQHSRL
jgi:hypothetical protein